MVPGGRGIWRLDRLDIRLVMLLGVALLPIGLIAITQTYRMMNEAEARTRAALVGETLDSVARERQLILSAFGATRALASLGPDLLDLSDCDARMRQTRETLQGASFVGMVLVDGTVPCDSAGIGRNISHSSRFQAFIKQPDNHVSLIWQPVLLDEPVIAVRHPITVEDAVWGYVAVTLPISSFAAHERNFGAFKPLDVITFSHDGAVLNAQAGMPGVAVRLPANTSLASLGARSQTEVVFRDVDGTGAPQVYAVTQLLDSHVHLMAVWSPDVLGFDGWTKANASTFPVLMWFASLAVAYFAVHSLVIRHIRALRRRIRIFSATRRIEDEDGLGDMPAELREVTEAFYSMTERILRDEADLENSLHEKDVLLREVHHRVKNNLQLIVSMTNMQIRKTTDTRTRSILRRLQDRVLGMAAVHRSLYETTSLAMVRADNVLREVSNQLARNAIPHGTEIRFESQFEPVTLYPDQALPLSLLLTEAMTNALKYMGRPPDEAPFVRVTLTRVEKDRVRLVIENSLGDEIPDLEGSESSGLGSQLIQAFTMQLGATAATDSTEHLFRVTVEFDRTDFTPEPLGSNSAG